jgi:hypothetical protein
MGTPDNFFFIELIVIYFSLKIPLLMNPQLIKLPMIRFAKAMVLSQF